MGASSSRRGAAIKHFRNTYGALTGAVVSSFPGWKTRCESGNATVESSPCAELKRWRWVTSCKQLSTTWVEPSGKVQASVLRRTNVWLVTVVPFLKTTNFLVRLGSGCNRINDMVYAEGARPICFCAGQPFRRAEGVG
eukprot:3257086-Amphidinium_carterae.1